MTRLEEERYKRRKPERDRRREAMFTQWVQQRVLKTSGLTFSAYAERCDAGEVPGLGPEDYGTLPPSA